MELIPLTDTQLAIINADTNSKIFLEGPTGCGKTTTGVERMLALMTEGISGNKILALVPQRTLGTAYMQALSTPGVVSGGMVTISTVGGLARRLVDLFWPLIVEQAGFEQPDRPATFLTLETAQYFMAQLVRPLLDEGFFDSLTISPHRLYSQILDNLNKSAVVGFPHTEIEARLSEAWVGEKTQTRIYADAQSCANRFRAYCYKHNLLDYSLQIELFRNLIVTTPICKQYLEESFHHLIYDNIEEDVPVAHDLLADWLPQCRSALLIYDHTAGFRRFLGADPDSGYDLKYHCEHIWQMNESFVSPPALKTLGTGLAESLQPAHAKTLWASSTAAKEIKDHITYQDTRYHPQMLDWVAEQIAYLVQEKAVPPEQIVILTPFLSDALRFSLIQRLAVFEIQAHSHRPSRSLREEPITQCLLTLSMIAHPDWGYKPSRFDVASAFVQVLGGLDLVRARLLTDIVYRQSDGQPVLTPFEQINPDAQIRITYQVGEYYERLRSWIADYQQTIPAEFDHFLGRLFGELLSQPGYNLHNNYQAGQIAANLIESVQKFRWVIDNILEEAGTPTGQEYLRMVQEGVIAAQYIRTWDEDPTGSVLIAPAHTYLMRNRPVDYQVWLDIGSRGWFERIFQPLTHPYVLSRRWTRGEIWTDEAENRAGLTSLQNLLLGLLNRCRQGIYIGMSELNEQGYEMRGPLLYAFNRVLHQIQSIN